MTTQSLWRRIMQKVDVQAAGGCWLWTAYVNPKSGYGQIALSDEDRQLTGYDHRTGTAPRTVCTLAYGPAPEGMEVLHLCHVRSCCAPHHLKWGTHRENNVMAWTEGAQLRGERHHRSKFTDAQIKELRSRYADGESATALARELGMNESYAYRIVKGQAR